MCLLTMISHLFMQQGFIRRPALAGPPKQGQRIRRWCVNLKSCPSSPSLLTFPLSVGHLTIFFHSYIQHCGWHSMFIHFRVHEQRQFDKDHMFVFYSSYLSKKIFFSPLKFLVFGKIMFHSNFNWETCMDWMRGYMDGLIDDGLCVYHVKQQSDKINALGKCG